MSLADYMLPEMAPDSVRLTELTKPFSHSPLFAGYDPEHKELLLRGQIRSGVEALTEDVLATSYKPHRNEQFVASLPGLPKKRILWDMEDAREFDSSVYTPLGLNVFQYNRRIGSRNAVLWRLRNYFEPSRAIGHAGRVDDELQFAEKKSRVHWRGALTGSRWVDPHTRVGAWGVRSASEFIAEADHFSRIKAVLISDSSPDFDIKLTEDAGAKPWLEELGVLGDTVRPANQLENKYILCLNGNDVASNLYWVLSSQSLAFKEDCKYEVLPDYFLEPWVHYVPISSGLSDLQEKFDYCESKPDLCRMIVENANKAYARMIEPQIWKNAEIEVLERLDLI